MSDDTHHDSEPSARALRAAAWQLIAAAHAPRSPQATEVDALTRVLTEAAAAWMEVARSLSWRTPP